MNKLRNKTEEKSHLDIFNNYRCDGQLAFDINGRITEEKNNKEEAVKLKNKQ